MGSPGAIAGRGVIKFAQSPIDSVGLIGPTPHPGQSCVVTDYPENGIR